MKLISWNVNGLRACVGKGFFSFMEAEQPDMLCLQETKLQPEQAPQIEGYYEYWNSAEKKGYSGVALFSKTGPGAVSYGLALTSMTMRGASLRRIMGRFIWLRSTPPIRRMS